MPVIEWFSDDKYAYSTALMFAYVNQQKLKVEELRFNFDYNSWENNVRPMDVLDDMKNKKYKKEVDRIKKAEAIR
jgi:hypothetical protein